MIFDDVCHDRSMSPAPRTLGQPRTLALDTVCPLDGDTLDDRRDCPTCPPEMRGAARRVIEIRRAALEPAVVVTYTGHGLGHTYRRDIPGMTYRTPTVPPQQTAPHEHGHRVPRQGRAL